MTIKIHITYCAIMQYQWHLTVDGCFFWPVTSSPHNCASNHSATRCACGSIRASHLLAGSGRGWAERWAAEWGEVQNQIVSARVLLLLLLLQLLLLPLLVAGVVVAADSHAIRPHLHLHQRHCLRILLRPVSSSRAVSVFFSTSRMGRW